MNKTTVGLIFGGYSTERNVSLYSAIEFIESIDRKKFNILPIFVNKYGKWFLIKNHKIQNSNINKINFLLKDKKEIYLSTGKSKYKLILKYKNLPIKLDIVFPLIHGLGGEDGSIQGLLNFLKIPYVGSDLLSSAICMNKYITKTILSNTEVNITPFLIIKKNNILNFEKIISILGCPFFVKPLCQGSSIGVSKVFCKKSFVKALHLAFKFNNEVILEKEIKCREISCAVLGEKISFCGEFYFKDNDFYSYSLKYFNKKKSKLIVPANIDNKTSNLIRKTTSNLLNKIGCYGMSRFDFFLDKENNLILNEINTIPGFSRNSMYTKLWKYSGLNYTNLITELINLSLKK